jgi:hypothetical protein
MQVSGVTRIRTISDVGDDNLAVENSSLSTLPTNQ